MLAPPILRCPVRPLGPVEADAQAPAWLEIVPVSLVETSSARPPNQATQVRVAASDGDLRILFECEDRDPWATKTRRDDKLYEEEVVEVFLDPVGDLLSYFEIELNPLNTVLDLVVRKAPSGLRKDFAWRCEGLRTAVQRTAHGWSAELAIPFASLMPSAVQHPEWRCNFCRIDRPRGEPRELSAWSPTGGPLFHAPHRFGFLQLGQTG